MAAPNLSTSTSALEMKNIPFPVNEDKFWYNYKNLGGWKNTTRTRTKIVSKFNSIQSKLNFIVPVHTLHVCCYIPALFASFYSAIKFELTRCGVFLSCLNKNTAMVGSHTNFCYQFSTRIINLCFGKGFRPIASQEQNCQICKVQQL